MTTLVYNPHGYDGPCNIYCQEGRHEVLLLAERCEEDGTPATDACLLASSTPYFARLGWRIVRVKRAEVDAMRVWQDFMARESRPIMVEAYATDERPVRPDIACYEAWLFFVEPGGTVAPPVLREGP